jgi:predicted nucleic acid-binding protein
MLGLVRQELLSGIRHKEQFNNILTVTRNFTDVQVEVAEYELAATTYNTCRAAGIAGNPVDFLLFAVAQHRNWAVLTTDKDFIRYEKCVPFRLMSDS